MQTGRQEVFRSQSPYTGQAEGWGLPLLLAGWRQDGIATALSAFFGSEQLGGVQIWQLLTGTWGKTQYFWGFPWVIQFQTFVLFCFGLNFLNSIFITTNNAFH